jgi:hypothetical protein
MTTLSIVIPAHNEAQRLEHGSLRVLPIIAQLGEDHVEVIVVDDGSNDDTGRRATEIYGHLPNFLAVRHETNLGKGAAVRLGFSLARGERVVVCDADMAIDPAYLTAMNERLGSEALVFGARGNDGAITYESKLRTLAGSLFNVLVRRSVPNAPRDTQCGFKGYQLPVARLFGLFGTVNGFAFDVEQIYLASELGLTAGTLAVTWDDVAGSSVRVVHDARLMLRDIRAIPRRTHECPVVRIANGIDDDQIFALARALRLQGLVVARDTQDALIVLPRDGAVAALEFAEQFDGAIEVVTLRELASRTITPL